VVYLFLILVLNERLDCRVEEMVKAGLLDELLSFHKEMAGRQVISLKLIVLADSSLKSLYRFFQSFISVMDFGFLLIDRK
jgi:tRNA A37 N6-isopentenylltransferase MiaA